MWNPRNRPIDATAPLATPLPKRPRAIPQAPSKFLRVGASFVAVVLAYAVYRAVAVPLIEPSANVPETTVPVYVPGSNPREDQRRELAFWFQPGDWELEHSKVLESPRAKLLFQTFTNKGEGLAEIRPCTLIFMPPPGEKSDEERRREAIVLQAPAGALLQFDQPINLQRLSIGRLVSAEMQGRITIRSDYRQPGPEDDLLIETRDIALGAADISTRHAITFRLGRNTGSGRELKIELLPAEDDGGSQFGPPIAGVRAFSLARDVKMHLEVDGAAGEAAGAAVGSSAAEGPAEEKTPLEVSCRGPFRFDLEGQVCTFEEEVDVLGLRANGPSDHITCRRLELFFASKEQLAVEGEAPPPKTSDGRPARLKPERLVAVGDPVVITAPTEHVHGRCQRLEYHLVTRQLDLVGTTAPIEFHRRDEEIHARELHYAPGEDEAVGRLLVVGPGWLKGRAPEEPAENAANTGNGRTVGQADEAPETGLLEIRFGRELRSRPLDGEQVVSIVGDAYVSMPDMGALSADEIHAWLRETPAAERQAAERRGEKADRLTPDRMMAQGRVHFDSPQLVGDTDKLEMWFSQEGAMAVTSAMHKARSWVPRLCQPCGIDAALNTADTAVAPGGMRTVILAQFREQRTNRSRPDEERGRQPETATAPPRDLLGDGETAQRVQVSGKLLRVQMRLRQRKPELTEVIIDGDARLTEIATSQPGELPLRVEGEALHLVRPSPTEATVVVSGRPPREGQAAAPALVEGRGLTLLGDVINLDQGQNRLWIDGPGTMRLLADRDLQNRPLAAPQPVVVTWRGRMNFDGSQAMFERAVEAALDQQLLETESLEVQLAQPVDFARPKQDQRPEVGRVLCRQGVTMTSRTYDETGLVSREQMQAADLTLDQTTGKLFASGPGWLKQVRFGAQAAPGGLPGGAANAAPAGGGDGLNYLHVEFQRGMTGNTREGQMTFADQVRAVYGPVEAWDAVIDPDAPGGLGERGFEMTCDALTVTQMPRPDIDANYAEMLAEGNAFIEGTTFTASGQRLTYDQFKDLLVLEGSDPATPGTGRTLAELTFKQRPGGPRSNLTAGRMQYWPGTNKYKLDDAREFFNQGMLPRRGGR